MDQKEAEKRIKKLRKFIDYHRAMYHTFDDPRISDQAFDALKNELEELENKHPNLASDNSPTQKVGGRPLEKFRKVEHKTPMLSFNDAFSELEMKEWAERVEKYLGAAPGAVASGEFYCELKIDGLAVELVYENGFFVEGSTRGDGLVGEDITENLRAVFSIPEKLEKFGGLNIPKQLVVRGEIFITKKEFNRINKEQEKIGGKAYANARNLAAGSVRQLDPSITARRKLFSFQYEIAHSSEGIPKTHEEKHKALASWGFTVNPHNRRVKSLEGVFAFRNSWEKKRTKLEYEIDGVVAIIDDTDIYNRAGVVGKAPRGAIAYKFSPREATTVVKNIKIQVGRTGVLTPVAELESVEVGGVLISRATLHNADEIRRIGLKIGDTVIVSRAGDVIPKITRAIKELRSGKERAFSMPNACPRDGSKVIKDGVLFRCSNSACGARQRESLYHFVSRGAFDIRGLGEKIIDRFLDEGLITDAADIFSLKIGDIEVLDRFGRKSAENITSEIEGKREISLDRFLYALGILHVGEETSRVLAEEIKNSKFSGGWKLSRGVKELAIENVAEFFAEKSLDDLQKIHDIGPKVAGSIRGWFLDKKNREFLSRLEKVGVVVKIDKEDAAKEKLRGKIFVFTGTLSFMSRENAKEKVRNKGGRTSNSVSGETDFLIVGENPGSKFKQAEKLGVKRISEDEFIKILG